MMSLEEVIAQHERNLLGLQNHEKVLQARLEIKETESVKQSFEDTVYMRKFTRDTISYLKTLQRREK